MEKQLIPIWRKSTYSGNGGGDCVEIADADGRVLVRDTKNRAGAVLRFPSDAWRRFAVQVKADRSLATASQTPSDARHAVPAQALASDVGPDVAS
jgi:hypothetical protein